MKATEAYLTQNIKANQLLESLPTVLSDHNRTRCQALFLGALRHGHRIDHALKALVKKSPHARTKSIFLVTGYEILSGNPEKIPQIIHHAVEQSKTFIAKSQIGLLNAVLRKLPNELDTVHPDNRPDIFFSHPRWLFKHWNKIFGLPITIKLMKWNQTIPTNYLKFYSIPETLPKGLEPTRWEKFYKVTADASWQQDIQPLLNKGNVYVKDPSTRLAPNLLAPKRGEKILDLCAAPGGKTYDLAHLIQLEGHIVALDLPGNRTERLRKNLEVFENKLLQCSVLEADLLEINERHFQEKKLSGCYDAVMLDAPCSNTGVIQRRTDIKWRLAPKDIERCVSLQKKLIIAAAHYIKQPGGRLVYSTCSIDPDENQSVVDYFLKSKEGRRFILEDHVISLPWETGHDGAGAFLFVAKK